MNKILLILVLKLVVFSFITSCTFKKEDKPIEIKVRTEEILPNVPIQILDENLKIFVTWNNELGFKLFKSLKEREENIVFSPLILTNALSAVYDGGGGDLALEIENNFGLSKNRALLRQANYIAQKLYRNYSFNGGIDFFLSFWVQDGFSIKEEFKNNLINFYNAPISNSNFNLPTNNVINEWFEKSTLSMLKPFMPSSLSTQNPSLIVTSGAFFKGGASNIFSEKDIKSSFFHTSKKMTVSIPFLVKTINTRYMENDQVKVLKLDLGDLDLSVLFIIPAQKFSFSKLQNLVTQVDLNNWLEALRYEIVSISIPKFNLTWGASLNEIFSSLGTNEAFSEKAYLKNIAESKDKNLFVSQFMHKSRFSMQEKRGGETMKDALGAKYSFVADSPFVFMFFDKKYGTILFLGKVINPTQELNPNIPKK